MACLVVPRQPVTPRELRVVLADPGLSFAAKGVLALVLSRPAGAVIATGALFAQSADPMAVIEQAVAELVQAGLLVTTPPGRAAGSTVGGVVIGTGGVPEGRGVVDRHLHAPKRRSAWGQRTPLTTTPRVVRARREGERPDTTG